MMKETGFNDPTAQRLERISTGAPPEVVGPLLADALYDPRWLECDVALISGGKSNLTYRVASDAGEVILRRPPLGHILPTARCRCSAGSRSRPSIPRIATCAGSSCASSSSGTRCITSASSGAPSRAEGWRRERV